MTSIRDLFPFTLSISPNQQTSSTPAGVLGWRFYNSKSSIPNGSANLFGKIIIRSLMQWLQGLVLDGALASTFQPIPLKNKMNLPAKAQSKDLMPGVIRLLPRLLPLWKLLLHLLFLLLPKTFSLNSWRCL